MVAVSLETVQSTDQVLRLYILDVKRPGASWPEMPPQYTVFQRTQGLFRFFFDAIRVTATVVVHVTRTGLTR